MLATGARGNGAYICPVPVGRGRLQADCGRISGITVSTNGYAHIRLTVTDIVRSRAFYEDIFGWPIAFEVPEGADESTREQLAFLFGGVIYRAGDSLFGLRPVASDSFDENWVGLDHLSFSVAGLEDLQAAAALLDKQGATHSGIKDIGSAHILEFRDPDNIALELYAAKA